MKTELIYEFLIDKENKKITIRREFDADLPLVWDAWTKPEILDLWWAPKPWTSVTKRMEFKEGGQRLYAMMGPNGEEHWGLTSYKTIHHHHTFDGADSFTDSEGNTNPALPVVDFEMVFAASGATTMVVNTSVYPDLSQLEATIEMGFKEGMTMALEGLDEVLASLRP